MALKRFPAEMEYRRNSELIKESVRCLHDWVENQPHLPTLEEEDIIVFLASCKLDEEYARKTIELHYTFKTQHPELFYNCDPLQENSSIINSIGFTYAMPGTMADGSKLIYLKFLKKSDSSNNNIINLMKILLCTLELMVYEDGAVYGWNIIFDMEDTTFGIISRIPPIAIKNILTFLQEAFPVQLRGIHIIRPKSFVNYVLALVKPFLKKSVADALYVHSNIEDLYKFVPKKHLPSDIGGDLTSVNELESLVNNILVDNRDILLHKQELRSNESLRPKGQKSIWQSIWG